MKLFVRQTHHHCDIVTYQVANRQSASQLQILSAADR